MACVPLAMPNTHPGVLLLTDVDFVRSSSAAELLRVPEISHQYQCDE